MNHKRTTPQVQNSKQRKRNRRRKRKEDEGKTSNETPAYRAIPAGYEDKAKAISELKRDGLPITEETIKRYIQLEEELQEQECIRQATGHTRSY